MGDTVPTDGTDVRFGNREQRSAVMETTTNRDPVDEEQMSESFHGRDGTCNKHVNPPTTKVHGTNMPGLRGT